MPIYLKCSYTHGVQDDHGQGQLRWQYPGGGGQLTRMTPRGKPLDAKRICVFVHEHGVS